MDSVMSDFLNFTRAAAAEAQPEASFAALFRLVQDHVGAVLFTVMTHDHHTGCAGRIWSSHPVEYPVGGMKPLDGSHWSSVVIDRRKTFVANSIAEISEVFGDWELIRSLGCESCINIPVVIAGQVLGTLNCLDRAGHYTPERVAAAEALKLPGALAFLLHARLAKTETLPTKEKIHDQG
jgi:GAF domain-containing protein